MQAYSQDLRDRVLGALERGERPAEIARRFEVSREWVYDVKTRFEKDGLRHRLRVGGHRISCVAPVQADLRAWIKKQPDLTLEELCERLHARNIVIKPSGLWHQLNQWGLSFKKKRCTPASKSARTFSTHEANGKHISARLILRRLFSSMKQAHPPT